VAVLRAKVPVYKARHASGHLDISTTKVQSRKLEYFGHLTRAENRSTSILHGGMDGKRTQGRPSRRWIDDFKDSTKKIVVEYVYIRLAQDRNCVERTTEWAKKQAVVLRVVTSSIMEKFKEIPLFESY